MSQEDTEEVKDEQESFDSNNIQHGINDESTDDTNFRALLGDVRDNNKSLSLTSGESAELQFNRQRQQSSFCYLFCCGTNPRGCCYSAKERFKSIFQRRASSLHPLDGLRAIAILWVVLLHSVLTTDKNLLDCYKIGKNPLGWVIGAGDLGVDIFFTLSGFLIAYILLKDCEQHEGDVDTKSFLRNRFLRIWPALAYMVAWFFFPLLLFAGPEFTASVVIPDLLFFNNIFGPMTHLWSVAVEFQMYLVSPFIIKWLYKHKSAGNLMGWIIFAISVSIQLVVFQMITDYGQEEEWFGIWFRACYVQAYARCSPYIFGMLAALYHKSDSDHKMIDSQPLWVELTAAIVLISISFISVQADGIFANSLSQFPTQLWCTISRPIYGLCLAYLILLMLSPKPSTAIDWKRPTKYMRAFLSSSFWIPIATISYSMYLWHLFVAVALRNTFFGYWDNTFSQLTTDQCGHVTDYGLRGYILFFSTLLVSSIIATFSYVFIEKPAIDARRVFKGKWE